MLLSKEAILAADDRKTEDVDVPEWGGTVRIREMSGHDRDAYEASLRKQRGSEIIMDSANMRAKLVARSVVGDDGELMFTAHEVGALGNCSAVALNRIWLAALRLNGMSEDAAEEAAGNSDAAESGDSI